MLKLLEVPEYIAFQTSSGFMQFRLFPIGTNGLS